MHTGGSQTLLWGPSHTQGEASWQRFGVVPCPQLPSRNSVSVASTRWGLLFIPPGGDISRFPSISSFFTFLRCQSENSLLS